VVTDAGGAQRVERTIAFVDLAGFTALTEAHGDTTALDLVDAFVGAARESVEAAGAELVKTIGDAVMLAAADPGSGLVAVRSVFEACYEIDAFPDPRGGLHHGPVLSRAGDYFGATVNLAARVAGRAGTGEVLGTERVAAAAQTMGVETVDLGAHALRNVADPVPLWAIELCPFHLDVSVDPVCRMRVRCHAAVARIRYDGVEHWLCSLECARAFVAEPDRYLRASER
jgi:adenylate cyclase